MLTFFGVEQRFGAGVEAAQIAQPVNPGLVVPSDQNTDPPLRVSCHLGRHRRWSATRQQPDDLEMGALDRVLFCPIPMIQLIGSEMVDQINFASHARYMETKFVH